MISVTFVLLCIHSSYHLNCTFQVRTNGYLRGHSTVLRLVHTCHICLSNQERLILIDKLDVERPRYPFLICQPLLIRGGGRFKGSQPSDRKQVQIILYSESLAASFV